jgi:CheY-like chemotaxis protein
VNVTVKDAAGNGSEARCLSCSALFGADEARWCHCDRPTRSLRCISCGQCFCAAPAPYKRAFWNSMPELRLDPRRFREMGKLGQLATLPPPVAGVRRPAIVVVDDDEALRSLVGCFVEGVGYRPIVVDDPFVALELAQGKDVRVLITDALMPRMDGRELCLRFKQTPAGRDRKVIVMTSLYTARRFRTEALGRYQVDEFLAKPLQLQLLQDALSRFAPLKRMAVTAER